MLSDMPSSCLNVPYNPGGWLKSSALFVSEKHVCVEFLAVRHQECAQVGEERTCGCIPAWYAGSVWLHFSALEIPPREPFKKTAACMTTELCQNS